MPDQPLRRLAIVAAVAGLACPIMAHPDDPKAKCIEPPYPGPGYRAAEGGIAGLVFPADGVTLLSWVTLGEFNDFSGQTHDSANDCWGYVSPSGREYAIIGLQQGTGFVEVTDPADATIVAVQPALNSIWRDIKTYETYAYAVTEAGDGIQVFDLAGIDSGVVQHVGDVTTGGTQSTHNVVLNEQSGYLYRVGGGGNGMRIYSLADPAEPQLVAEWSERYVHDAQIVTFDEGPYAGREIAFLCSGFNGGFVEPGLDIVDVTDKQNMILMARYLYPMAAYSHQAWLSQDRQHLFLNDEFDEGDFGLNSTMITIDVSDLENPFVADTFANGSTSVTHNLFTRGDVVFASNYSSGLRVFDVSSPTDPAEIGYFDTDPDNDDVDYTNLWGNYPFLPSGIVLGSDRSLGLFVWDVTVEPEGPDADVNQDGVVNVEDLVEVITSWGACGEPCPADIDGDGQVSVTDLVAVITNWG